MNRRLSREEAVKLLYQMSINKYTVEEAIENYLEQYKEELPELDIEYIKKLINGVNENIESLDKKIEMHLTGWKMNRISKINLALLRCSTYEIINNVETPAAVFINEAVEIAKRYSEDKSVAFINGVLDKIAKSEGRI
ncbi:transcription antitermination factor NusB [Clostridium thermarum]|uniref:transcription antitermination factor NusB n=1 Tax=Clostridium thermarum TaxID=1716543 RepID=UPI0013D35117|nr:transcription antitermination factor NusB [Clostridium thermarum]